MISYLFCILSSSRVQTFQRCTVATVTITSSYHFTSLSSQALFHFIFSLFTILRIISCHLISYHCGSYHRQFSLHHHFILSADIIARCCPAPEPLRGWYAFVRAVDLASHSTMQYPWPFPYWPQHPLQLTVPVPHPHAFPVPIPIQQQEPLPSQPPTLVPQHQPPHQHPATPVQHPSSPTGQTTPPPWDYSQGVWQPCSVFPPVAHPTTGVQAQAQTHPNTSLLHQSTQQLQTRHHLPTQQQGTFQQLLLQPNHLRQTTLRQTNLPPNLQKNRTQLHHQPPQPSHRMSRSNKPNYLPLLHHNHYNTSRPPLCHHHHHRHH